MGKRFLGDIIGFREDGRPIYLMGGGSEDEGHPNEGGTPPADSSTEDDADGDSLLEDDADDLGSDDSNEKSPTGEVDVDALAAILEKRLGDRFDAIADRRVNAILKEVRGGKTPPKGKEPDDMSAPSPGADVRGARLAFREYLGDQITFVSAEERSFAMEYGAALVGHAATQSDDEDEVGKDVAAHVATALKDLRRHYEKRTKDALRKRGALVEKSGQPPKGPATPGGRSEWQSGSEQAKAMFADRLPTPTN